MAKPFNFGEVHLTADGESSSTPLDPQRPFCLALIGDFSGRASRDDAKTDLARRKPILVDRDNLDEVIGKLDVRLRIPISDSESLALRFERMDDFHPDRLYERCPLFDKLRELRLRVNNPATFARVAEELGVTTTAAPQRSAVAASTSGMAQQIVQRGGSLLDAVVEAADEQAPDVSRRSRPDQLQEFVRKVSAQDAVAATDPRQHEILQAIDRALSAQMRALLHVPAFQALEAAWRSVFFMVRRVETGPEIKIYLFDIAKDELAADLSSASDLHDTATYNLFVEKTVRTPGAEPFAAIIGNYVFGEDGNDPYLLAQLATMAQSSNAPFIAGVSPRVFGCESLAETPHPRDWQKGLKSDVASQWSALRHLPQAAWLGLVLPRLLQRLPYGRETDPIDSFEFEEMPGKPVHEDYLWGNAAFACALLLAQSFSDDGWDMRPRDRSAIDRLPLHVYKEGGETEVKACAETLLTEEAAERIMQAGFMPLVSLKATDEVRLLRFQSAAEPLRALRGPWMQ